MPLRDFNKLNFSDFADTQPRLPSGLPPQIGTIRLEQDDSAAIVVKVGHENVIIVGIADRDCRWWSRTFNIEEAALVFADTLTKFERLTEKDLLSLKFIAA